MQYRPPPSPNLVLKTGTKIRTAARLAPPTGLNVSRQYLAARQPDTPGRITGWVASHSGAAYWVEHEGSKAVYRREELRKVL